MDVCSPGELRWALDHGWEPSEISYTGTNVSARDLDAVLDAGVHLNVDLLSQLDRVGRRAPGSTVGVRINPRIGAAFPGGGQTYAGDRPTKFGIYPERLDEALDIARRHDLTIDTVHVHAGYLYLSDALPVVEETMRRVAAATRMLMDAGCPIVEVNTGGGLGVPFRPGGSSARPRCMGRRSRAASRAARRHRRDRARRVPREGVRGPSRRGGERRGSRRDHVHRTGHRLERDERALRLQDPVPSDPVSRGGRRAGRERDGVRVTSTRATICSPRTIRCRRSRRVTSWRSRTSARTTPRWCRSIACAPTPSSVFFTDRL